MHYFSVEGKEFPPGFPRVSWTFFSANSHFADPRSKSPTICYRLLSTHIFCTWIVGTAQNHLSGSLSNSRSDKPISTRTHAGRLSLWFWDHHPAVCQRSWPGGLPWKVGKAWSTAYWCWYQFIPECLLYSEQKCSCWNLHQSGLLLWWYMEAVANNPKLSSELSFALGTKILKERRCRWHNHVDARKIWGFFAGRLSQITHRGVSGHLVQPSQEQSQVGTCCFLLYARRLFDFPAGWFVTQKLKQQKRLTVSCKAYLSQLLYVLFTMSIEHWPHV